VLIFCVSSLSTAFCLMIPWLSYNQTLWNVQVMDLEKNAKQSTEKTIVANVEVSSSASLLASIFISQYNMWALFHSWCVRIYLFSNGSIS
jgi:hypothetical protein